MIPASSISFKINANFLLPLCVAKMKKMIPRTAKTQDFCSRSLGSDQRVYIYHTENGQRPLLSYIETPHLTSPRSVCSTVYCTTHRRRIELEDKAKVGLGDRILAAL